VPREGCKNWGWRARSLRGGRFLPGFAMLPIYTSVIYSAFCARTKKSEAELNFLEKSSFLREKQGIVGFLKYRLSSALLDLEGEIWCQIGC
jgi:hypothetical protein